MAIAYNQFDYKRFIEEKLLTPDLEPYCERWKIQELELFGSALREDFNDESDIDLIVTYTEDRPWSLLDHVRMEQELEKLIGRKVDMINRKALLRSANHPRRDAILSHTQTIYRRYQAADES